MPSPIGVPAPEITLAESQERDWTIVRWCHKVADSVSSKFEDGSTFGKWLGRTVFAFFVPFGIIPSLLCDATHGIESLLDRYVEMKEAIEKKIPNEAQIEALQEENRALLMKASVAKAEVITQKFLRANTRKRAEEEIDSLIRDAENEKAALREQAELGKAALIKKANDEFQAERTSKLLFIKQQADLLEAKNAKIQAQLQMLIEQEQKLADLEQRLDKQNGRIEDLNNEIPLAIKDNSIKTNPDDK